MNETDCDELVQLVRGQLRELGLDALADPASYRDEEGRDYSSRELVVKMLAALKIYLPLEDRNTYHAAMTDLRETTNSQIESAEIALTRDQAALGDIGGPPVLSFEELPDQSGAREALMQLISDIQQDPER